MNTPQVKSPKDDDTAEMPVVVVSSAPNVTITAKYAAYITFANLAAGLRRRTLLDERYFRQLMRQAAVSGRLDELASELSYPPELVDDELTQFLYHSSQIGCSVGVEYASYGDDWDTIKRKFAAYIATPGIDDLWYEINKAINALERNPDPITAPGVVSADPK